MYFDIKPKEKLKDFYNYRDEYNALISAMKGEDFLIVLKGLRRVGKTSLMKVSYHQVPGEKIWIDARSVNNLRKAITEEIFEKLKELSLIKKAYSIVEGLDVYVRLKKTEREEILHKRVQELDEILQNKKTFLYIYIDEVQLFPNVSRLVAYILDNTKRIKFIISGSEVGLVERFLGEEYESALFGRAHFTILMESLPDEKSKDFLRKGAKMAQASLNEKEIDEAVSVLDGTIGWLTLYGFYKKRYGHSRAIREVLKEGKKVVSHELNNFLKNKGEATSNYVKILRLLSSGKKKWSDIKLSLSIDDKKVSKYLKNLMVHGFIINKDERYLIPDPVLREYFKDSE